MTTKAVPYTNSERVRDVFDTIDNVFVSSQQSSSVYSSTTTATTPSSSSSSIVHTSTSQVSDTSPSASNSGVSLTKTGTKRAVPLNNPLLDNTIEVPRHNSLRVVVAHLCMEKGFAAIDSICLETLVEMLTAFIMELGRSTKSCAELGQRTIPTCLDFNLACSTMGINVSQINYHARRLPRTRVQPPLPTLPGKVQKPLEVGTKRPHPSYILPFYPEFPDPHTYIYTQTEPPPLPDYKTVREKISVQRQQVEVALCRYISKTRDTECMFADDPYAYPLIANCVKPACYRAILMPKSDQHLVMVLRHANDLEKEKELSAEQGDTSVDEETSANKTAAASSSSDPVAASTSAPCDDVLDTSVERPPGLDPDDSTASAADISATSISSISSISSSSSSSTLSPCSHSRTIDNPFLREIKMPRSKR